MADAIEDLAMIDVETPKGRVVKLRKGDTLWKLAQREYGNADFWRELAAANGITDPTKLQIGQEIILPDVSDMGADTVPTGPDAMAREPMNVPTPRPNPKRSPAGEAMVAAAPTGATREFVPEPTADEAMYGDYMTARHANVEGGGFPAEYGFRPPGSEPATPNGFTPAQAPMSYRQVPARRESSPIAQLLMMLGRG